MYLTHEERVYLYDGLWAQWVKQYKLQMKEDKEFLTFLFKVFVLSVLVVAIFLRLVIEPPAYEIVVGYGGYGIVLLVVIFAYFYDKIYAKIRPLKPSEKLLWRMIDAIGGITSEEKCAFDELAKALRSGNADRIDQAVHACYEFRPWPFLMLVYPCGSNQKMTSDCL